MSEFLTLDREDADPGYYDAMSADNIADAHNLGGFIVGQETQGDRNRTIEVRDLTPNPQKLQVHVGAHT